MRSMTTELSSNYKQRPRLTVLDAGVGAWAIYYVLRTWLGAEYPCATAFLTASMLVLGYVALRVLFHFVRPSARVMRSLVALLCLYEVGEGVWQLLTDTSRHALYPVTGLFLNPGPYSATLMIGVVLGAAWWRQSAGKCERQFALCVALVCFLLLPATMSRAAFVSLGVVMAWLFRKEIWAWKYRWAALAAVVLALAALYFVKQGSADGRMLTWVASLTSWTQEPWLGWGIGGFRHACGEGIAALYQSAPASSLFIHGGVTDYAYCDLLKVLVEQGVVGALLCLVTVALTLCGVWKSCQPLACALVTLLLFSLFSYPFELWPYQLFAVVLAAWGANNMRQLTAFPRPVLLLPVLLLLPLMWWAGHEMAKRHKAKSEAQLFAYSLHAAFIKDYYELLPLLLDDPQFLFDFAKTLRAAGRYADSNAILRQGTMVSSDPMFFVIIGNNSRDLALYKQAECAYQKAYAQMPNRLYPLYQLMTLYEATGQQTKAQATARRLIAAKPKVASPATEEMVEKAKLLIRHQQ